jgi:hypothetical protein
MAHGGHVRDIRVLRVHPDTPDVPRIEEPLAFPGPPCIGTAEHAVAMAHIAPDSLLASAHPDDVRVGRGDGHGTDGAPEVAVTHARPRVPAIGALEHPSSGTAEVPRQRIPRDAGNRSRTAAPVRSDGSESVLAVQESLRDLRRGSRQGKEKQQGKEVLHHGSDQSTRTRTAIVPQAGGGSKLVAGLLE